MPSSIKYLIPLIWYIFCQIGRRDSSGVRFHHTSHLREYDAGIMSVGERISKFAIIPPKQESWLTVGYCPKECYQVNCLKCSQSLCVFMKISNSSLCNPDFQKKGKKGNMVKLASKRGKTHVVYKL